MAEIKANENADMIVCVSHSGTWDDPKKSEDELLAKGVPDLDLILSGHTHSRIREPIRHGDTYVVSCGEYGKNLGSLTMAQKADGRWQVTDYQLIPITADIPADAETQEVIDRFMDLSLIHISSSPSSGAAKGTMRPSRMTMVPRSKVWRGV